MRSKLLLSLASIVTLATVARAGADTPSSLLLFPEYNSAMGVYTVISVVNTKGNGATSPLPPAINAHFVYINGVDCSEVLDRDEPLTPNDIVTVIAGFHNSGAAKGFLYVFAQEIATGKAVKWDYLIGSQMQLDGITAYNYSYNPIGFKAAATAAADLTDTDIDMDGIRDLNGVDYEATWNEILIPSFFGQTTMRKSYLVLLNLTGGYQFEATADFSVYDDYENKYSTNYRWRCWVKVPLSRTEGIGDPVTGINNLFNNTFLGVTGLGSIGGAPGVETGWMRIKGTSAGSGATQVTNPSI